MIIENQSWDEYINYAGGFTYYADKKAAYVIKANGESYVLSSGYFKKELFPESGDTLVVPRDLSKLDTMVFFLHIRQILTNLSKSGQAGKIRHTCQNFRNLSKFDKFVKFVQIC